MKIGKRKIFLIIGLIVLVLAACSNVDGDLDDKWQLRQYQYADGSIERQDSISAICLLKNGSYQTFFGNYSLKGDKISIILLPQSMEDENYSFYMGWENGERTFTMEELTSSSLHLEYEGVRYIFRRY